MIGRTGRQSRSGVALVAVVVAVAAAGSSGGFASASSGASGVTKRVSVNSNEGQADYGANSAAISANGRYVVFQSYSSNLVRGDTNDRYDVFLRDRTSGTTRRMSVSSNEAQADDDSGPPKISADGRYVVFASRASNLVVGDTNEANDVFVRDRATGTTRRVSVDSNEVQGSGDENDGSSDPAISWDGRYVTFTSEERHLVSDDTNDAEDIFVRDRVAGTTSRVSITNREAEGNDLSLGSGISSDGRFVTFFSGASNLVRGDTNNWPDVFVRDRAVGTTRRLSVANNEAQSNNGSHTPTISADGRYVAFTSYATNLVTGDTNSSVDIFVRDRVAGTTRRASVASNGTQANSESNEPALSADGRYVGFYSSASNLVRGDTNAVWDVFVRDLTTATTRRVSVSSSGNQANEYSYGPAFSADGRRVAFVSWASNLVNGDTNGALDVFVRITPR